MLQSLKKKFSHSDSNEISIEVKQEEIIEEKDGITYSNYPSSPSSSSFNNNTHNNNSNNNSHSNNNIGTTHITTKQLSLLSTQTKTGYLSFQKLNSIIVRWKRKYFILGGNYLRRCNNSESIEAGEFYKELVLTESSTVTHTDINTCFIVKSNLNNNNNNNNNNNHENNNNNNNNGNDDYTTTWILKAETPEEANDWIVHISSHIHQLYLEHHPELNNFDFNKGSKRLQVTFWTLPTSNSAGPVTNPVGIRSLPDQNGPRTGSGIYPGEIFEVVQQIYSSSNGVTILQLADDRGFVFDKHPTGGYDLIIPLQSNNYLYQERSASLLVNKNLSFVVPIFFSPSENSSQTNYTLKSGEECLVSGLFTLDTNPYFRSNNSDENWLLGVDYVKLRDGRGWVPTKTPSNEQVFIALSRKRGDSTPTVSSSSSLSNSTVDYSSNNNNSNNNNNNNNNGTDPRVRGNSMFRKKVSL